VVDFVQAFVVARFFELYAMMITAMRALANRSSYFLLLR